MADTNISESDTLAKAIERLAEMAVGFEVASDCERRIFAAYQPEWDYWETRTKDPEFKSSDELARKVRNALDARNNAKRIQRDADAIRTVLAALTPSIPPHGLQVHP